MSLNFALRKGTFTISGDVIFGFGVAFATGDSPDQMQAAFVVAPSPEAAAKMVAEVHPDLTVDKAMVVPLVMTPVGNLVGDLSAEFRELDMHRADYRAIKAAGFDSPGELLAAYTRLNANHTETKALVTSALNQRDAANARYEALVKEVAGNAALLTPTIVVPKGSVQPDLFDQGELPLDDGANECAANGTGGCNYGPHGPNGERQCEWCGGSPCNTSST